MVSHKFIQIAKAEGPTHTSPRYSTKRESRAEGPTDTFNELQTHRTSRSHTLTVSMTAAAIAAVGLALWLIPVFQVRYAQKKYGTHSLAAADLLKAENEQRSTLAQIFGGVAVLAGLYYTSQTLRLQQAGQLTDRINKAVEQLASDKDDMVLGGIYQIRRIADDSPPDRWPMLQILLSYVERNAKLPQMTAAQVAAACDPNAPYDASETAVYTILAVADVLDEQTTAPNSTPAANQAISIVHSRLRHINLAGSNLKGARLVGDDFTAAILTDTVFATGANLNFSRLNHANLSRSNLAGSSLQYACLVRAQLTGADLSNAHLEHADLRNLVDATGAKFSGVTLDDADLRYADLSHASGLAQIQLSKARMDCTTMLPLDLSAVQSQLKCAP